MTLSKVLDKAPNFLLKLSMFLCKDVISANLRHDGKSEELS